MMKKYLGTVIGVSIISVLAFAVFELLENAYGVGAGWFASIWIIGLGWYINHAIGIVHKIKGGVYVNMALGIGIAGILKDVFAGKPFAPSAPTLFWVIIGGILGGYLANKVNENLRDQN